MSSMTQTNMTVADLIRALQSALDRGLPPDTAVVVDTAEGFRVVDEIHDPSDAEDHGYDLWFTVHTGDEADARFTPGGMPQ